MERAKEFTAEIAEDAERSGKKRDSYGAYRKIFAGIQGMKGIKPSNKGLTIHKNLFHILLNFPAAFRRAFPPRYLCALRELCGKFSSYPFIPAKFFFVFIPSSYPC